MSNSLFNYFSFKVSQETKECDPPLEKITPRFPSPEQKNKKKIQVSKTDLNENEKDFQNPNQTEKKEGRLKKIKTIISENNKKEFSDIFTSEEKKTDLLQTPKEKKEKSKKIHSNIPKAEKIKFSNKKAKTEKSKKVDKEENESIQILSEEKEEMSDTTPDWAKKENALDAQKRPPSHPDYDPSTLYVPKSAFEKMTPAKRQYWICKSKNFDKVILFKLGKFYELFYEDAIIAVKYLELNFMGKKEHAGFPEQALDKFLKKLVDLGFKVAIVEQVETDSELKQRIQKEKPNKFDRIIKRDLVSIHTKGTYVNIKHIDDDPELYYLWSLYCDENRLSIVFFNFQTNRVFFRILYERVDWVNEFKLLAHKLKPSEIIFPKNNLPENIMLIINNLPHSPLKTEIPHSQQNEQRKELFEKLQKVDPEFFSDLRKKLEELEEPEKKLKTKNFLFLTDYLDSLMLLEKSLFCAKIDFLTNDTKKKKMVLDAQALTHLQIFETEDEEDKYSLFWLINKCVSNFGKRKLKKWLASPSFEKREILARQEAIIELEKFKEIRERFQNKLKSVRDLEKLCFYLIKYSLKTHHKIIFFGDVSTKKINELQTFFMQLKNAKLALEVFEKNAEKFGSLKIKKLLEEIPDIYPVIESIQNLIDWEEGIPRPKKGYDKDFDFYQQKIENIEKELNEYLEEIKSRYNNKEIKFIKGKFRFEIEIPENVIKKKGRLEEFRYSSKKANFERFTTDFIENKISEIELQEEKIKESLYSFLEFVFRKFSEKKEIWLSFISILASLDVLCGLSEFSHQDYIQLSCPLIEKGKNIIKAKNIKHPVLSYLNSEFVGNDVNMNEERNFYILTGPNMGGKSTIMRTISLNLVLAQIGCFVFAEDFRFSLVDRIFTRIGASDKLEEKKSTFFIEMEEMLTILKNATPSSLAIIDELGRGTSTFDGYAIASSVVKFICTKINCNVFFATHYFFMKNHLQDLEKKLVYNKMDFRIIDDSSERIVFLYKLVEGICEKSFAFNVAILAGVPEDIIERAKAITSHYRQNLHI